MIQKFKHFHTSNLMRKLHLILTISLFNSINLFGQWINQPSGTTQSFRSVFFSSTHPNNGWATTANGLVFSTSNAGALWTAQNIGMTGALEAITFVNSNEGWTCGSLDRIYKTSNGGGNWNQLTTPPLNAYYQDMIFLNNQNGWAVGQLGAGGGAIINTIDGGTTWSQQTSGTAYRLNGVYFTSSTNGIAVGNFGTIIQTTNGGNNWSTISTGITQDLESVYFSDALHGWAVGDFGKILGTIDGGLSWNNQTSGTTSMLRSVYFISNLIGWTAGDNGVILSTNDGGITWTPQNSTTTEVIFQILFTSATNGYAVGDAGKILTTNTGGFSAINELTHSNSFMLYPNPATKSFTIKNYSQKETYMQITNPLGEIVRSEKLLGRNEHVIDIEIPSGIYFVRVGEGESNTVMKLVVE